MTGDTLGGLVAAVRDHLAPLLIGRDADHDHGPALRRSLVGNTGAHSALEMALLDLAGRASGRRLIDIVARPVAPHGGADVAARERDAGAGHRGSARTNRGGVRFLQAEDRREAARRRDRRRARHPRGASRSNAVRRCELRAHARGGTPLSRTHARGRLGVRRATARRRRPRRSEGARAQRQDADRHGRNHPVARRHRGRQTRRREGRFAQADQARRLQGSHRSRKAVQEARPEDQRRRQDRRVRASGPRLRCISPARCRTSTGA